MPRLIPAILLVALALSLGSAHHTHAGATRVLVQSPAHAGGLISAVARPAGLDPAAAGTNNLTPAPAVVPDVPETPAELQRLLEASAEEWAVIYPKLQRIAALRDEVNATSDYVPTGRGRRFNGPAGNNSLDEPIVNPNGRGGRFGSREFPFDPEKAPGNSGSFLSTFAGGIGRAIAGLLTPGKPNSVQVLLADLQTMVDTPDTPGWQLAEKIDSVRAARTRAVRELGEAQQDILPLLSTDQIAALVALGCLD